MFCDSFLKIQIFSSNQFMPLIMQFFFLNFDQGAKASGHQHTGGQYHSAWQRRAAATHAGQTHHCAVPPGHHWGALQTYLCLLEPHHTVSSTTHTHTVELMMKLKTGWSYVIPTSSSALCVLCQCRERRLVSEGLRGGFQKRHPHQLSVLSHDQLRCAHGHLQERGEWHETF